MKRITILFGLSCVFLAIAMGQARGRAASETPCVPHDGKLKLKELVTLLYEPAMRRCALGYVKNNDVDFKADQEVLDVLDGLDAPQELIDLIPAAPPPPKPVPVGTATINVTPPDSEIFVGDQSYVKATAGRAKITGPVGDTLIRVVHDGFVTATWHVLLEEGKDKPEDIPPLNVTDEHRRQEARTRLLAAVNAFGGTQGLERIADVPNSGTLTLLDEKQQAQEWTIHFSGLWAGSDVTMRLGDIDYKTLKAGGPLTSKVKHKNLAQEDLLNNTLERLRKYQLPSTLGHLLTRSVIEDYTPNQIKSDDGEDSYVLNFGPDGLPEQVVYQAKPEATPVKVRYSGYLNQKGLRYPGRIEITDPPSDKPQIILLIDKAPEQAAPQPKGK